MVLIPKARAAAFRARLQMAETERDLIVGAATKHQVNLARITDRIDRLQNDIRGIHRELNLLELSINSDEETAESKIRA